MKKDIEWLKKVIRKNKDFDSKNTYQNESYSLGRTRAYQHTLELIDQLDEPEVEQLERKIKELESFNDELIRDNNQLRNELDSQEVLSHKWISDHIIFNEKEDAEYIYADELQNLLVPKRELPVIPKYVAEYLEFAKSDVSLMRVLELANTRYELPKWEREYDWISENSETFARAWLDGYEVEEEQKYYVSSRESAGFWFLSKNNDDEVVIGTNKDYYDRRWENIKLTEQEIKDFDPRYWAFRNPVDE